MRKLLFLVILAVVLFLFNPDQGEFNEFIENQTTEHFQRNAGDSKLSEALSELGGSLSALLAKQVTERKNYFLFSTYTIALDGDDSHDNAWRYLGIAGQFFKLQEPEDLHQE